MTQPSRSERRAARRTKRAESPFLQIPFKPLRNRWRPSEFLALEQLDGLHAASLTILENVGLDFLDAETLDLWEKAGARVDHAARHVWLERGLVMGLVAQAPRSFTWRARNPERDVFMGEDALAFGPSGGMIYASDLERGRRPGTHADYEDFVRLAQLCNVLHFAGGEQVAALDVPVKLRHLRRLHAGFTLSDKAVMASAQGRVISADNVAMAALALGDLDGDPVIGGVINVSSPLRYEGQVLGGLLTYARAGQVCIITPFNAAGTASHMSMAAGLAQQNAEALAGVALAQLARPGAPVVYGGFTTNPVISAGDVGCGLPAGAWALMVGAQLARRYGLPCAGGGSLTTSKVADGQAAYETQWGVWPCVLAHTNLILHAAGWLEGGLTASFEKFIIDAEALAMFQHMLGGFTIEASTLALDMIAEVGPGGHHFGTSHTQERFSTEFYQTFLADRQGYENWVAAGSPDSVRRAHDLYKDLLAHYEPPLLDPAIAQALADYAARRSRELEGGSLYE